MSTQIKQDQLDFAARLAADPFFSDVPVFSEDKGVTETDIATALSTLNTTDSKIGAVVIVLAPTLVPDSPDAPGPHSKLKITVQVIDQPLFNLDATNGIGKTTAELAERVRMICHQFNPGTGKTYVFAGQEPLPVDEGKTSVGISFTRLCIDPAPQRVATPTISPYPALVPSLVVLDCTTPGASLFYTLDGTYPSATNGTAYTEAFTLTEAATVRVVATLTDYQQSNVRALLIEGENDDPETTYVNYDILKVKRATLNLTEGDTSKTVTFAVPFTGVPQVFPVLVAPTGGFIIGLTLDGAATAAGFTVSFSAPIPASGYKLSYMAVL